MFARTRVSYSQFGSDTKPVTPRLRGPERPVYQPRDQVFWHTALLDIELNIFLLTKIGVHEIYTTLAEAQHAPQASLSSTPSRYQACGTPAQRTGTPRVPAQRSSLLAHGTA